jgi:hypothetical protein
MVQAGRRSPVTGPPCISGWIAIQTSSEALSSHLGLVDIPKCPAYLALCSLTNQNYAVRCLEEVPL